VGPGFLEEYLPDGPEQSGPDDSIKKEYFKDRKLRTIETNQFNLDIAGFSAFDYFGDGSFYLINSPGVCFPAFCKFSVSAKT
jgi:hypothetical protein